ncbi:MAG: hypothetical protein B7Z04_06155 [Rhodobacterales bacterium 32-66-9]|nr:MAG: hypothetical protein B7Z04_06155 [Rhodobacterales bacterium 32-66-9]
MDRAQLILGEPAFGQLHRGPVQLVAVQRQHFGPVIHSEMIARAKGEEFLLRAVLAVHQKDLMRGDVKAAAEIFEKRGFGRFKLVARARQFAVGEIAASEDVQRALGVRRVHALKPVDAQIGDEGAARSEDMAQVRGPGRGFVNRLGPPDAAAEADKDDIRPAIAPVPGPGRLRQGKGGRKPDGRKSELTAVHRGLWLVNRLNITRTAADFDRFLFARHRNPVRLRSRTQVRCRAKRMRPRTGVLMT